MPNFVLFPRPFAIGIINSRVAAKSYMRTKSFWAFALTVSTLTYRVHCKSHTTYDPVEKFQLFKFSTQKHIFNTYQKNRVTPVDTLASTFVKQVISTVSFISNVCQMASRQVYYQTLKNVSIESHARNVICFFIEHSNESNYPNNDSGFKNYT